MAYEDSDWRSRNPFSFKEMGEPADRQCECGETLVRDGIYFGTQDHPWRPPRVECDCGKIHQIVGLPWESQNQKNK